MATKKTEQPVVTTWDQNARNYSVTAIINGLDGWSQSAKKLARSSAQPEATKAASEVIIAVQKLEALLQQPTVKAGQRAPKAEDLDAFGVPLA
jgi:hypothetical protein